MLHARIRISPSAPCRAARASILIYAMFLVILLIPVLSLAVDFGRVQTVKTELQRAADATARGTLQMSVSLDLATAQWAGPAMATGTYNPVDGASTIQPTVTLTWGWWNAATKTFVAGAGSPTAVRVTLARTAANGNAVPLIFPLFNGFSGVRTTCDVSETAIAVLTPAVSATSTVPATADLWLAGMPPGSNAGWSDSPATAAPVLSIPVTPGSILTFAATGLSMYNGPTSTIGAEGAAWSPSHMQGSPDGNYNGLQNGIQTVTAPQNSLIGVFLTNNAPNTQTPPANGLDFSTAAARDPATLKTSLVQQPFFIGDGQTSGGTVQQFVVPPGATRLFLGVFDGWQNWDNPGFLSVTTTQKPRVTLVR